MSFDKLHSYLKRPRFFVAVAPALGLFTAAWSPAAEATTPAAEATTPAAEAITGVTCRNNWNSSPASAYCIVDLLFSRHTSGVCSIGARCSITVTVGETRREFRNILFNSDLVGFDDVPSLDLCFSVDTETTGHSNVSGGWRTDIKAGCDDDDTTSATAVQNGLPAAE